MFSKMLDERSEGHYYQIHGGDDAAATPTLTTEIEMNTNHDLLPGDAAELEFEKNADLYVATAAMLNEMIPGSSWTVEVMGSGCVNGRVGCVEIELYATPDGGWGLSAGPTTYRPADLNDFELRAYGESALELVQEMLGEVWQVVSMSSRFAA
jgi:hypothetical protein